MRGAILYTTKHGSTTQYANWIAEATGLPVFNINKKPLNLSNYDFLVIGTPIYYYKLLNRKWINRKWKEIQNLPIVLFTVSGAGAGAKLDGWIANSNLPERFISKVEHIALKGRQRPEELSWFERIMLNMAASKNPDPKAREEELNGFDYMDKLSIAPIVNHVKQYINPNT